ncbi:uncharacterized protein [Ptychodera flava]|uniref:uncharacterized protein n=1 Tax=Ptychodera flava TaxID=63121 RepID=UPI00396A854B
MTTNMDHFRGVPSSNSERDRGLYDENLSNIKLGSDTYGKNIFEKNMPPAHQSLYGDHSDINSTPSQQVPTNSPLLPRFLQQSSLAYSDSSAASSSVPTFYDQASLWMKTEDRVSMVESRHRGPLMDYTTNKTQDSCCHVISFIHRKSFINKLWTFLQ